MEVFPVNSSCSDHLAMQVYCAPDALYAYEQWLSYPTRALYEGYCGPTVSSIMRAYTDGYLGADSFPLRDFDIFVALEGEDPEEAGFAVTVYPSADDWLERVHAQIRQATNTDHVALFDGSGNPVVNINFVVARRCDVFVARAIEAPAERTEAAIGVAISRATPVAQQMELYAGALAKRIYKNNKVKHLKRYAEKKKAAYNVAESVARELGLDRVLTAQFQGGRTQFYSSVATYIRANARDALDALARNPVHAESLRRAFVNGFATKGFAQWIGAPIAAIYDSEGEGEEESEEEMVGESIDCEYETYSDMSGDDESDIGASIFGNLRKSSKLVTFKLERRVQEEAPRAFGWTGRTALEPGDIIHTVVHAAPKPKKKNEVPPSSVIVDFQMKSRNAKKEVWLTVNTVELMLPSTGKATGTAFVVPLDDALFRAVVYVRRPGSGWQMTDVEGTYEFNVNPRGTKAASKRNYPVTWEQVSKLRRNATLRAKYSVPEYVFHARLINMPPFVRPSTIEGEFVDYFVPNSDEQLVDDERLRTFNEQKERGFAAFVGEYNQGAEYKSDTINEVRQLIWAINNNRTYAAEFLKQAAAYDSEYTGAAEPASGLWEGRENVWDDDDVRAAKSSGGLVAAKMEEASDLQEEEDLSFGEDEVPATDLWEGRENVWDDDDFITASVSIPPENYFSRKEPSPETAMKLANGRIAPDSRPYNPAPSRRAQPPIVATPPAAPMPVAVVTAAGGAAVASTPTQTIVLTTTAVSYNPAEKEQYEKLAANIRAFEAVLASADSDFKSSKQLMAEALRNLAIIDARLQTNSDYRAALVAYDSEVGPLVNAAAVDAVTAVQSWYNSNKVAIKAARATSQFNYTTLKRILRAFSDLSKAFPSPQELSFLLDVRAKLISAMAATASASASSVPPTSAAATSASSSSSSSVPPTSAAATSASSSSSSSSAAPVTIDDLFNQLEQQQMGAPIVDTAAEYVAMTVDALTHTFDKALGMAAQTMDPKYFGGVFARGRRYVVLIPNDATWKRALKAMKKGQRTYVDFLRDHAFEVPEGTLFAHSRRVELRSLSGKYVVALKRTHDADRNITTVQMTTSANETPITGKLDTNVYTDDYKVHTVKMQDWTDFSA